MAPEADSFLEQGMLTSEKNKHQSWYHAIRSWISAATLATQRFRLPYTKRHSTRLRPTAYLDGMRGCAAVLVYILHNEGWAHTSLKSDAIFENGFGYNKQYYFACLPGIRLLFSGGHFSVAIFFVVSGYVLSLKPLQLLLVKGEQAQATNALASALFRRWIRLFMPLIVTSFIYMTFNYLIQDLSSLRPETKYHEEVWKWYAEFKEFSFIFRMGGEPWFSYNFHAWTIPLEFKGSIVIYTSIMAFSQCTQTARLWCQVALISYFLWVVDGWYCASFVTGMLLCELDLLAAHAPHALPKVFTKLRPYQNSIFMALFIVGLYLGGAPAYSLDVKILRDAPGWYYLSFLKPQAALMPKAFFLYWSATFITVSVPRISWLKAFFELPFVQFLGRHSYGFYLAHGPIIWTIGDRVYAAVGWPSESHGSIGSSWVNAFKLPHWGPLGLEFNFIMAQFLLFPLTLWTATLVTTFIDEPSIRFSQWIYKQVLNVQDEPKKLVE